MENEINVNVVKIPNGTYAVEAIYSEQELEEYKGNPFIEALPLIRSMEDTYPEISYLNLVGTDFKPRGSARCNGIIQATIHSQKKDKPFVDNWTADGFLRWAYALGFVSYNYLNDSFKITDLGKNFISTNQDSDSNKLSEEEKDVLRKAIISYPPAVRILDLLANGDVYTKFDIGSQLGFIGEKGFTSLPQNVLLKTIALARKNGTYGELKISDWDGTSDKYARQICSWLFKLDMVMNDSKSFNITINGIDYTESLKAYSITAIGLNYLGKSRGTSSHKKLPKRVCWEMLCLSGNTDDRYHIRTRRALILKCLSETQNNSFQKVKNYLDNNGFNDSDSTILDDISGLCNMGLHIENIDNTLTLLDTLYDFEIPIQKNSIIKPSKDMVKMNELRDKLKHIPHKYLSLIDLAYDGKQHRMFEMNVMEFLLNEYLVNGSHLGGASKPDGILYDNVNHGYIVDAKAYSKGFSLPIHQSDEMGRYVKDNTLRNSALNATEWWSCFPERISDFCYLFVVSECKGDISSKLKKLSTSFNTKGSAINIENLLIGAELIKSNQLTHDELFNIFSNNQEVIFSL